MRLILKANRTMKFLFFTSLALSLSLLSSSVVGRDDSSARAGLQSVSAQAKQVPDTSDRIWSALTSSRTCVGCKGILLLLKSLAALGDDVLARGLTETCLAASTEDRDVCSGTMSLIAPVLGSALRDMSLTSRLSNIFCASVLGLCDYPAVDEFLVPTSPPPPRQDSSRPAAPRRNGQALLRVAHFSDIHVDPLYVAGSNANCSKPMCCRPYTPADEPGNNDAPAGPFGDHNCGAPVSLEQSMYEAIQRLSPDFAIFTGDIVDHAVWNTSVEQNSAEISRAYQQMNDSGIKLVYGTVGNHEMSPINAIPPKHLGDSSAQWLYDVISKSWSRWIGTQPEAEAFGVYSVKYPGGNLRIVSVSTNMWYNLNLLLYRDANRDPGDELARLVKELDAAEKAGERAYIIGHMPIGSSDAFHDASNYFDQVINRYKSTIAAMFFGKCPLLCHTHLDHFQISYSNYQNRKPSDAVAVSYIAPSLTPLSGMPAFRIYSVNPVTFGVVDIETYYADMDDPEFQQNPVWKKYYSAREAFGTLVNPPLSSDPVAELSPSFWHNVTVALESNSSAFNEYWSRRTRGWRVPACDDTCRANEVCRLRAARSENNCVVPTPGASFGIRSEGGPSHVKQFRCDRSVVGETLGALAVRKGHIELLEKRVKAELAREGIDYPLADE
ncbi:sphingomyelin phosphodiesterase [Diaporthe sp. PMI_573]|nr:sphingomyelin phosphodiesterase [Diaporthaceae sp. PMI_573]